MYTELILDTFRYVNEAQCEEAETVCAIPERLRHVSYRGALQIDDLYLLGLKNIVVSGNMDKK